VLAQLLSTPQLVRILSEQTLLTLGNRSFADLSTTSSVSETEPRAHARRCGAPVVIVHCHEGLCSTDTSIDKLGVRMAIMATVATFEHVLEYHLPSADACKAHTASANFPSALTGSTLHSNRHMDVTT
jgi:hypothetical protein